MGKYDELLHLLISNHIIFANGKLTITDMYEGAVNNTSNLYYTNKDVQKIIEENQNLTIKSFIKKWYKNTQHNDYTKKHWCHKIYKMYA